MKLNTRSPGIAWEGVPALRSALMLLGAFAFAFLLGETTHEIGHYLADRAYGVTDVRIDLDPLGGSRIVLGSPLPEQATGIAAAAGPLLNIILAVALFILVWQKRRPILLPLLLWCPLALIQEGVTFSAGLQTPGGDGQWIAAAGIPVSVITASGVSLLVSGIVSLNLLLPLADISPTDSFARRFGVLALGMMPLMLLRIHYSAVPCLFSGLLAVTISALHGPLQRALRRFLNTRQTAVPWSAVMPALAAGITMVLFQLAFLN